MKIITATLRKGAKKAIERRAYRYKPLTVKVGVVSVTGHTVKQCWALTKCAKRLSASTPIAIKSDVMSVSAGAMTDSTKVVSTVKELAEATPPHLKFMGISVKAGTVKKVVTGVVVLAGVVFAMHYGMKWINQKFTKPTNQNSDKDLNGEEELQPKDQSVRTIRNERTFSNFDDGQLVGQLIYKGDKAIIFSEFGTGKSVLTMGIALDIALGRVSKIVPNGTGIQKPQTVFYYDGENDSEDYFKIFGEHPIDDAENLHFIRGFYFENPRKWVDDVRKRIRSVQGDVTIILDNISCILSSFNANVIRVLFEKDLTVIQNDFAPNKVTFIVVAHTNKNDDLMGSVNQLNFATTVLKLSKQSDKYLELEIVKNRKYGDIQGKTFLLAKRETEDGFKYDEFVGTTANVKDGKRSSKASQIPPEAIQEIKDFYQKGVPDHGYQSVIKAFELDTKYGITDSNEVRRIIES